MKFELSGAGIELDTSLITGKMIQQQCLQPKRNVWERVWLELELCHKSGAGQTRNLTVNSPQMDLKVCHSAMKTKFVMYENALA